jgi:hypothetical protein
VGKRGKKVMLGRTMAEARVNAPLDREDDEAVDLVEEEVEDAVVEFVNENGRKAREGVPLGVLSGLATELEEDNEAE